MSEGGPGGVSEGRPRAGYTIVATCRRCEGRRGGV